MQKKEIIPPIKILSRNLKMLVKKEESYFFREKQINKVELCGFVYNIGKNRFSLVDFYGEVECYSWIDIKEENTYVVLCGFVDDKITCFSARVVGYHEEIVFWLEAVQFSKKNLLLK